MGWLSERLKKLIEERDLTIQQLSQETGIPRPTLSLMVTGRYVPSEEVVRKLATHFGEDAEEWAFNVKVKPVLEKLKEQYPNQLPAFARRLGGK